jgi:2'-phosphotransferase
MVATAPSTKRDVQISKALSALLRHKAEEENLSMDPAGFVLLEEILQHNRIKSHRTTLSDIRRIVDSNDKKRFTLEENPETGKLRICANQGHSIKKVGNNNLVPLVDRSEFPQAIIHGTYMRKLPQIMLSGLSRMKRNHIHFTYDESPNLVISGMRENCTALIYLDIDKCVNAGIKFFRSANNVILSAGDEQGIIPANLFLKVVTRDGSLIAVS